jgi:hypothetical protein
MKHLDSSTSYIDLLFNLLAGITVLLILAFMMIKPVTPVTVKPPAEIMIVMDWPPDINDDVDLWVQDSLGNIVWYSSREGGFMTLDRDDLGHQTDELKSGHKVNINREVVYIRGLIPGEYTVNIFMYSKRDSRPNPVKIEVIKVDPHQVYHSETIVMTEGSQEITAIRFTIDDKGKLLEKSKLHKSIVVIRRQGVMP